MIDHQHPYPFCKLIGSRIVGKLPDICPHGNGENLHVLRARSFTGPDSIEAGGRYQICMECRACRHPYFRRLIDEIRLQREEQEEREAAAALAAWKAEVWRDAVPPEPVGPEPEIPAEARHHPVIKPRRISIRRQP